MEVREIRIFSTNIGDFNSLEKRRIFKQLQMLNAGVICLQETYLRLKDQHYLSCKKFGHVFILSDCVKKRDIAAFIKERLKPILIFFRGW